MLIGLFASLDTRGLCGSVNRKASGGGLHRELRFLFECLDATCAVRLMYAMRV